MSFWALEDMAAVCRLYNWQNNRYINQYWVAVSFCNTHFCFLNGQHRQCHNSLYEWTHLFRKHTWASGLSGSSWQLVNKSCAAGASWSCSNCCAEKTSSLFGWHLTVQVRCPSRKQQPPLSPLQLFPACLLHAEFWHWWGHLGWCGGGGTHKASITVTCCCSEEADAWLFHWTRLAFH